MKEKIKEVLELKKKLAYPGTKKYWVDEEDPESNLFNAFGEASGSTSEAEIIASTAIPTGYKLLIYDVEMVGKGESEFFLYYSADGSTWTRVRRFYLRNPGSICYSYSKPIELDTGYVKVTYVQPTAAEAAFAINGKLKKKVT